MPEESKNKAFDVDGTEELTKAIDLLLTECPLLEEGQEIVFSTLEKDSGIGWFPISGAVIISERKSVTGNVFQHCNYPFYIIYRTGTSSARQKMVIKEFLDSIGKWLELQKVKKNDEEYTLESYPLLTEERKITEIKRQSPSHLSAVDNGIEDWAILISLQYKNEFRRK